MSTMRKFIAAAGVGLLGWGTAVVQSSSTEVTATEWIMLGTVILASLAVFGIKNDPQ